MPIETDCYAHGFKQKKLAKEALKEIFGVDETMSDEEVIAAIKKAQKEDLCKRA